VTIFPVAPLLRRSAASCAAMHSATGLTGDRMLQSVLEKAAAQGIALYVAGGRIIGRGAKPDPAFLAELREHEAELVTFLRETMRQASP
jgi:hypothetical protein